MKSYREPLDYKQNLIKGAKSKLFEFAKEMRKNSTSAEELLWDRLRRNALGFKFRRQHPFGNFIPDFYCSKKKIAIEVDGSVHSKLGIRQNDVCRSEYLKD